MSKHHSPAKSFSYASSGIGAALKNEPNIRIHLVLSLLAIILGLVLRLSSNEWIILFFTIAFVLVLELINTTLEAIVDIVSPKRHPKAKLAKDVAAAAVFISAVLSLIVAGFIFVPKLL